MIKRLRKGFTLVELVIVIAVIAVLAAVLIPTFSDIIEKANNSADLQEARNLFSEALIEDPTITEGTVYVQVGETEDNKYVIFTDGAPVDNNKNGNYTDELEDGIELVPYKNFNKIFVKKGSEIVCEQHTAVDIKGYAATCTEPGLTYGKKCSVCNEILVEQEEIPAKGHNITTTIAKEATCTSPGYTEGKKCTVCNEVLVVSQAIDKKDHVYDPTTHKCTYGCGAVDPTYCVHSYVYNSNNDVTHITTCSEGCGHEIRESHNLKYESSNSSKHTVSCDICGYNATKNHTYIYTNNEDGTHTVTCYSCEYEESVAHNYEYTDNGDGTHTVNCYSCGFKGENETHTRAYYIVMNEEQHADRCEHCDGIYNLESHEFVNNKCKCGKERECEHEFAYVDNGDDTHTITCIKECGHNVRELHLHYLDDNSKCIKCDAIKKFLFKCESCGDQIYCTKDITPSGITKVYDENEVELVTCTDNSSHSDHYVCKNRPTGSQQCNGCLKEVNPCNHSGAKVTSMGEQSFGNSQSHYLDCSTCNCRLEQKHTLNSLGNCRYCGDHQHEIVKSYIDSLTHKFECKYAFKEGSECTESSIYSHVERITGKLYIITSTGHKVDCSVCVEPAEEEPHTYDNDADAFCNICNYERCIHSDTTWTITPETHKQECNNPNCLVKILIDTQSHIDENEDGYCDVEGCNRNLNEHVHEYIHNSTTHSCNTCNEVKNVEHTFVSNQCTECGVYKLPYNLSTQIGKNFTQDTYVYFDENRTSNFIIGAAITINSGATLTLDLQEKVLNANYNLIVENGGCLIIKNGTITGKPQIVLKEGTNLTLEKMYFGQDLNSSIKLSNNILINAEAGSNSTVNINDCNFYIDDSSASIIKYGNINTPVDSVTVNISNSNFYFTYNYLSSAHLVNFFKESTGTNKIKISDSSVQKKKNGQLTVIITDNVSNYLNMNNTEATIEVVNTNK